MSRVQRSKSLPKSVSKVLTSKENKKSKLVTGDKLCVQDDCEIKEGEYAWEVKIKDEVGNYNKRLLVVGPKAVRVVLLETKEEVALFPYSRMKEFSQNESYKSFQIVWHPSKNIEETIYFKTSEGADIQNMIGKFIKDLLVAKNVTNPDELMFQHTFFREPDATGMKAGGRSRSTTRDKKQVKRKKGSSKENDNRKSTVEKTTL